MPIKITALLHAYNEEERLPALFESLKGLDEIILIDHLSTDNTAKLAKKLGAKVITRPVFVTQITKEDVMEFERRFGHTPVFTEGNMVPHFGDETQFNMNTYPKNDWVFFPYCDEIVTWNLDRIREVIEHVDIVSCRYNHTPNYWFWANKLFKRSKTWWEGRIHETVMGIDPVVYEAKENEMIMNHYQVERDYRATYLPILEYAMLKDMGSRTNFYLAREYFAYKQYEKAILFFKLYLKKAWNHLEIYKAHILIGQALYELGRSEEAIAYVLQSIKLQPNAREGYETMSKMSDPARSKTWLKLASTVDEGEHYI